jgi:DNA-binding response OmpR family regulator
VPHNISLELGVKQPNLRLVDRNHYKGGAVNTGREDGVADRICSILVVDDDSGVANLLAEALSSAGYLVTCADNGETGWTALCAGDFDLIITDHSMPLLSGLNLLRRMRANSFDIPAILISADMPPNVADLIELLSPGTAMHKPFSISELLENVRTILARERVRVSVPGKSEVLAGNLIPSTSPYEECTTMQYVAAPRLKMLSRQLLAYESNLGKDGEENEPAVFGVCNKLRGPLRVLAGEGGFQSILSRALALAGSEVGWLKSVKVTPNGFLNGLGRAEANLTIRQVLQGETVLIAQVLGLLMTFIGESVTLMLLQGAWPEIEATL